LWNEAQKAAQAGFSELIENATAEILKFKLETEIAKQDVAKIHQALNETLDKLGNATNRIAEAEKIHAADTSTLAAQDKSLKTLQNERDNLERSLEAARAGFSCDLEKLNVSLAKAEERYRALEARSLLEVDRSRQNSSKLEKELNKLRETTRLDQASHQKELSSMQNTVTEQREKIGMLNGQLSMIVSQHKETTKQLRFTERKFEMATNKLLRLQSSPHKKIKLISPSNKE
jgi:chromosome segregation ATPase